MSERELIIRPARCCHQTTHHFEEDSDGCCHDHVADLELEAGEGQRFASAAEAIAWLQAPEEEGDGD